MKIVIPENQFLPMQFAMDKLSKMGEVVLSENFTNTDFATACIGADIVIVNSAQIDNHFFETCPSVKFIIKWGVGVNNIDLDMASERGVIVGNCPHYGSLEVAEWALIMTLNYMRNFMPIVQSMKETGWADLNTTPYGVSLRGKTVGVIGLGRIGMAFAKMVEPFGAKVVCYSQSSTLEDNMSSYATQLNSMEEVLSVSDVVSLNLALNDATTHIINKDTLCAMKKDAILINVSRGALVDADAVLEALDNDRLGGYLSDVFEVEPLAKDNPLQKHPKTLLTPHMAYLSEQAHRRLDIEVLKSIQCYINKDTMVSILNADNLGLNGYHIDTYPYGQLPHNIDSC